MTSLLPVRSRTGTELSEPSKERKGLNMVAVGDEVPSFALNDKRLLSLPRPNGLGSGPKLDQISPWGAGQRIQRVPSRACKRVSPPRDTLG